MITTDTTRPTLLRDERQSFGTDFNPVSLSEVKDYLEIAHSQDDTMIGSLRDSAVRVFEDRTSHYLQDQTRRVAFNTFSTRYRIPASPVRSLDEVETVDEGSATTETISEWWLEDVSPPEIKAKSGVGLSNTYQVVRFKYTAGYASENDVPEDVKTVLKKMVADMYEYRTSKGEGLNRQLTEQPMAWDTLLAPLETPYYSQPKGSSDNFFL